MPARDRLVPIGPWRWRLGGTTSDRSSGSGRVAPGSLEPGRPVSLAAVGRLARYSDYRFIGLRDTMIVYDCDDADQFAVVEAQAGEIEGLNLISTFAPDTEAEARNRGFRPAR